MRDEVKEWCDDVAELGVDMLLDNGVISKEQFAEAVAIVSAEIHVRLCLGDYPPQFPTGITNQKTEIER